MGTLYLGPTHDLSKIQGKDTNYDQIAHFLAARKTVATNIPAYRKVLEQTLVVVVWRFDQ